MSKQQRSTNWNLFKKSNAFNNCAKCKCHCFDKEDYCKQEDIYIFRDENNRIEDIFCGSYISDVI